jgi:hypothetical protein
MYQGRSLPALNTLISGQAEHPLAEYYQALDQWLLLAGLFVVLPLALSLFFWGTHSLANSLFCSGVPGPDLLPRFCRKSV